jgi:hypothetical protein
MTDYIDQVRYAIESTVPPMRFEVDQARLLEADGARSHAGVMANYRQVEALRTSE